MAASRETWPLLAMASTDPVPEIFPASVAGSSNGFIPALRMAVSVMRTVFTLKSWLKDHPVSS